MTLRQFDLDYHVAAAGCCAMQAVDPLATIVHREAAYKVGKALAARLKELIPRQQFKVPIQAAIGARIVASEAIPGTACTPPHSTLPYFALKMHMWHRLADWLAD